MSDDLTAQNAQAHCDRIEEIVNTVPTAHQPRVKALIEELVGPARNHAKEQLLRFLSQEEVEELATCRQAINQLLG